MEKQAFIDATPALHHLPADALAFLRQRLHVQQVPKYTQLVPLGGVSDRLYFLYAGLARSYYLESGKEMTSWLAQAGALLCVPESFLAQQPSREAIQLLEDSTLVSFSHADLQALYAAYPGTNKLGRWVAERYLTLYSEQARWLRATSAEERFRQFITKYPELYEKVPLKHIASYLGMAPETVSRILKKKN
ncbi:Crp/Fnr family transcriptional regulator [Rhabdobacter roseus]|uniref:CRP-like cAMP-binding protein n=1 Tax=Rhabdobacter roseus TaxID=1655419 RepID=A0A840TPQ0_9BACT|nr:Crp/Fnr family transcriptional regulator [Rhabdobacter roseus]MBB5284875.1 CRP-like cAMP-binding protein [Rhabdobacter roseus]